MTARKQELYNVIEALPEELSNKVMEYIRWKVIRPLLDLESCSPSSDNKIIPF